MDKILLEVDIDDNDVTSAITEIQKATAAINELKTANMELAKQGQANSTQFIKNNEDIKTLNKTVGDNSRVVQANNQLQKAAKDSIDALRAANVLLLKEKNSLSTSDEASKKRITEINALYDKNNKIIGENSSATEKQKFNIGNYSSALDKLVPGLGGAVQGIEGTTKAGLAFIATPLGAVIGAIGLAVATLTAYFKGSEKGQNDWNKVVAVGSVLFEKFQDVLEAVGEALFDAPKKLTAFGAAIKIAFFPVTLAIEQVKALASAFERFFPETAAGIKKFFTEVSADAKAISDLEAEIDAKERALNEQRAITARDVAALRQKAAKADGVAKRGYITEAIALEKSLADVEIAQAKRRLDLATQNVKIGKDDKAGLKEKSDAQAAYYTAQAAFDENTLRMAKELEALRDKDVASQKAASEKKIAQTEKELAHQLKVDEDTTAFVVKAFNDQLAAQEDFNKNREQGMKDAEALIVQVMTDAATTEINILKQKLLEGTISHQDYNKEVADAELAALTAELELKKAFGESTVALEGKILDAKLQIMDAETAAKMKQAAQIADILGQAASLFGKQTMAFKILATAQAIMNTYVGAAASLKLGWPLGPIGAALTIVQGLAAVAKINAVNVPTAEDGIAIPISGRSHTQGGEDISIGGRKVANAQSGEHLVVLKRGANDIFHQLSRANELAGGVAFATDQRPRYHMADGGFVARSVSQGSQSLDQLAAQFSNSLKDLKIYTRTTELAKVQKNVADVKIISELR